MLVRMLAEEEYGKYKDVDDKATKDRKTNFLLIDEQLDIRLLLPVNPEEVKIKRDRDVDSVHILNLGDVDFTVGDKLKEISFSSFFPFFADAEYCNTADVKKPMEYVKIIDAWFSRASTNNISISDPIRFLSTGSIDINLLVTVSSFEFNEKGGEPGEIYYSMTLKEWRPIAVKAQNKTNGGDVDKVRPVTAPRPKKVEVIIEPGVRNVRSTVNDLSLKYYYSNDKQIVDDLYSKNKVIFDERRDSSAESKKVVVDLP